MFIGLSDNMFCKFLSLNLVSTLFSLAINYLKQEHLIVIPNHNTNCDASENLSIGGTDTTKMLKIWGVMESNTNVTFYLILKSCLIHFIHKWKYPDIKPSILHLFVLFERHTVHKQQILTNHKELHFLLIIQHVTK